MIPAPPRAVSSAAQAWDIMRDDVTLRQSLMTHGFNEQRQKDLLALGYEDRQKGNSGYYLPACIELEIRDTNERAQALYDACCEVWENHGRKKNRVFYRAVFDNCLQLLFGTRRGGIAYDLQLRDTRMGTPGRSKAALGSLTRRMGQLSATWIQKLENETRDCETRERVERERAALLPSTQVPSTSHSEYRPQASQKQKQGRKEQRPRDFTTLAGSLWKQKKGPTGRVSHDDLKAIGGELDSHKFTPPADYLEATAAADLKASNSKNARSRFGGAIRRWNDLVQRGDKNDLQAMRKLLSRCAAKSP